MLVVLLFYSHYGRRLVDMLSENEDVISFCPGFIENGEVTLGRIVVHDRIKVENDILPRYFNHSSFASLRRQLNYFSFTRIGKGRQKGATYCNEGVIVLEDILRLRRRSTTSPGTEQGDSRQVSSKNRYDEHIDTPVKKLSSLSQTSSVMKEAYSRRRTKRSVSDSSSRESSSDDERQMKKVRNAHFLHHAGNQRILHVAAPVATPNLISPIASPLHSPSISPNHEPQVTLDLTVPVPRLPRMRANMSSTMDSLGSNVIITRKNDDKDTYIDDPDVLAGCRALLCFSHGLHSLTA